MTEAANETMINGIRYKFGEMDPRTQFHVARRLSPILGAIVTHVKEGGAVAPSAASADDLKSLVPIAEALASLDDATLDYILDKTLAVVERQNGDVWARVAVPGGALMFQDIKLPAMLQLAWGAIQANIGGFSIGSL